MVTVEATEKKKKSNALLIILLVLILISVSVVGFFILKEKQFADIAKVFKQEKEYTLLLNQFVVNLQTETGGKSYLKMQIALMYTDKKAGKMISSNESKIRDVILKNTLEKTPESIMDGEKILSFKKEIITNINKALNDEIVKDVYFTDFIIQ